MAIMTKDEAIQVLAVGVAAGGVGAGFAALFNTGFQTEDVFAFLGALAGAAATIAGAVWLTDRTERTTLRRESGLLCEECEDALDLVRKCLNLLPAVPKYPLPREFQDAVRELASRLQETRAILREATARAEALDFRQRVRVVRAESAVNSFLTWHWDDEAPHPLDERTYDSTLTHVEETVAATVECLRR